MSSRIDYSNPERAFEQLTGLKRSTATGSQPQPQRRDPALDKLQQQLAEVDRRIASNEAKIKDSAIYRGVTWVGDKLPGIDSFREDLASEREAILANIQDIERSRQTIQQTGTGEGGFSAALKRGVGNLRSSIGGLGAMVGDVEESDIQNIQAGRQIANANPRSAEEQAVYEDFQSADGFIDSARVLFTNPRLIANLAIESLPASGLSLAGGVAGSVAGAGAGALSANPAGVAVGGRVGGSLGSGLGSFATEYGNAMLDTFVNNGVDIDDPEALKAAIADPNLMAEARDRGVKRGIAVGAFDALSAGLAGKLGVRIGGKVIGEEATATVGRKVAGAVAGGTAEIGMQGTLGGAGEAAGQIATEGKITSPQDVLAEFAGEIPGGIIESGAGAVAEGYKARVESQPGNQREDTDLMSALQAFTAERPADQPVAQIEDQNAIALRDMGTMRVGGLNLTAPQVLEFAANNANNPRIGDIMSQPVADTTKVEQVARVLNSEQAARVEPETVRRISGMIGGTTPVSTTRQFIQDELAQIGDEVVNESPVLSALRDTVTAKGKDFVNGLRSITGNYSPPTNQGQTFVARPERGGEGSVIMTPDQTAEEAQREREAQQAFRMAERRQQRFDQATGQGTQREDIRPGAPEPAAEFFLGEAYGDLAGTAATVVETAAPGVFRVQYESPTETDANGTPITISEEVPALDLLGRVVRGTPRMTQELAGSVRKPRRGTGTDMNPRQSVDRTTTRAVAEAQQPQPPMVPPQEPNLTMTGRQEQPFQYEAQPSLNAQEMPVEDNANPEGMVESQAQVSGAPGATALPAPPRGLPAPEAPKRRTPPPAVTEREETAPGAPAEEANLPEQEEEIDIDNDPRMVAHNERYDEAIERVQETENATDVRKLAKRMIREGIIDEDDYSEIDSRMKDVPNAERWDEGMAALEEAIEAQRDNVAYDIEEEITSGVQYSGRRDRVRGPRVKASEVVARTMPEAQQETQPEPQEEETVDYEAVINDRLDKIAERGAQGRVIASRLRGLLKDKSLTANQLYYAIRMGEVFGRVLPKNSKIDILFVPSMKATNAMAAAASGTTLGADVTGSYKPYEISQNGFRGLITMSLAEDMLSVSRENAAHEAFHVIQDMLRAYDPEMFSAINSYFKDGMRIDELDPSILRKLKSLTLDGDRSVYQSLKDDFGDTPLGRFEAQAVAFGALVDAKDRGENMKGLKASIARFVDMLSNLKRELRKVLSKPGTDKQVTIAEVFEGYRTGKNQEALEGLSAPLADGSIDEQYSARTKPDPVRTQKAYKLFRVDERKPGQLFPLFVNANDPVPVGEWLDADVGPAAGNKVKSKLGPLAMRPGWHAGDLPIATHIGAKSKASLKAPDTRPDNQVWAEVEFAADRDWQGEANSRAKRNANGEIIANTAHITDQIPEDGFYRYKTNPNMTGNWLIGGSMKVTHILSDAEVEQINKAAGVSDLPRAKPFDTAKYGFDDGVQYSGRKAKPQHSHPKIGAQAIKAPIPATSTIPYLYDNGKTKPEQTPSEKMALKDAVQFIQNRTRAALQKRFGIDRITGPNPVTDRYLMKAIASEAEAAILKERATGNRSALDWYTKAIEDAIEEAAAIYPMLRDDGIAKRLSNSLGINSKEDARVMFTLALSITSQNMKVRDNAKATTEQFDIFLETGRFDPSKKYGTKAPSISANLSLANYLLENVFDRNVASLGAFLNTEFTVAELNAIGRKIQQKDNLSKPPFKLSGELATEKVYGSAIFGPKIGNGFYQNLNRNFSPVTIDLWFMRLWGRLTGTLVGNDTAITGQIEKLRQAVEADEHPTVKVPDGYVERLKEATDEEVIGIGIELAAEWERQYKAFQKQGMSSDDITQKGLKPDWAYKAVALSGQLKPNDVPGSGSDRKWIRDVVAGSVKILAKNGYDVTPADLQALVWYPEKDLINLFKEGKLEANLNVSYDTAFAELAVGRNGNATATNTDAGNGSGNGAARQGDGRGGSGQADVGRDGAVAEGGTAQEEPEDQVRRTLSPEVRSRLIERGTQYSGRTGQDLAVQLRGRFKGTPRAEAGTPREGNVGRRSGGVLAPTVTGRVPVAATYSHSAGVKAVFEENGYDAPDFHELTRGKAAARLYSRLINDSKQGNRFGASVYVYPAEDYEGMRLFVTKDGMAGFALKGDDIVSAFKSPKSNDRGVAFSMVRMGVALGGRRLDAFDTVLPSIYSVSGFRAIARMRWNDDYAPDDWSKETFKAFNNGEPDVVFMAYDPNRDGVYEPDEGEYTDDYDDAVARQTAAAKGEQYSARTGRKPAAPNRPLRPTPRFKDTNLEESTRLDDVIYNLQDKLIDVKRLQQNIEKSGKAIGEDKNVYRAEELYHGRAAKRAKDFVSRELTPLLQDMKSKGVSLETLDEFLHARHAKERNAQIRKVNPDMQDGGSGLTDAEADAYMQSLPNARRQQLEKLAKRVDAIVQETQKMSVAYGLETQATIDTWNNTYKAYVPLQREGFDEDIAGSGAQGLSVRGGSSRRAMGSDLGVVDVLANVAMQRERIITRGERNRVGNAMLKLALENPNDSFWFVIDPKSKSTAMAEQKLVAFGVDPVDAKEIVGLPTERFIDSRTGRLVVRANSRVGSQPNVLATRVNGEDRYVIFNARNPRAARTIASLKNLDTAQIGAVLGTIGKVTRYFAAINTQYNPAFGLFNLMRDVQGAAINLGNTPLANDKAKVVSHVLTAGMGMYRDLRAERRGDTATSNWAKMAEEFELAGGKTGFRDMFRNSQERADSIERELSPTRLQKVGDTTVGPIFNWLSDFNEAIENSVRLSAYKVARDKGLSIEESASIAKNITVNFNRKGNIGTQTGMIYAFFNASVQGTARMAEALTGPTGKKIIAGGLLLGVVQAMALAAAGFDDDEIPDWLKDKNLVIPTGGGKYIAIPMPLGYHAIPALSRRATEFFMSGSKSAVGEGIELMSLFADAFNPIGMGGTLAETLSPTVTDPVVQLAVNRDFAGRPIYNENFNSLDPTPGPERTREGASIVGEFISRAIDTFTGGNGYVPGKFSPTGDQVDFTIGAFTGGAGRTVLNTISTVKAGVTGEDLPNYKIPFVGRMIGDKNEAAAVSGRFYENLKEVNGHQRTIKGMEEKGEDTTTYLDQNPGAYFSDAEAQDYERQVTKLKKERKELIAEGDKEGAALVGEELQQLMAEFNQRYMDAKKGE